MRICLFGFILACTGPASFAAPLPDNEACADVGFAGVSDPPSLAKADSTRVKRLLALGERAIARAKQSRRYYDSADVYAIQAEVLSMIAGFDAGRHRSREMLSRIAAESGRVTAVKALFNDRQTHEQRADMLLIAGQHHLYRMAGLLPDLDTAEHYLNEALNMYARLGDERGGMECVLSLGMTSAMKEDFSAARAYRMKVIPFIAKITDPAKQAQWWYRIGECYSRGAGEMAEKIAAYERSRRLYRLAGDTANEAHVLKTIADMHQHEGAYAKALEELLEVLQLQKSVNFPYLHYTYDLLGHVHARMGNYERAIPYAVMSIENARATGDTSELVLFYNRAGNFHSFVGQHAAALEFHRKILNKFEREPESPYSATPWFYIGLVQARLLALNRPEEALALVQENMGRYPPHDDESRAEANYYFARAYLGLKNHAVAERYLLKGLQVSPPADDNSFDRNTGRININYALVEVYLKTGQYTRAGLALDRNLRMTRNHPDPQVLLKYHHYAFRKDSLEGNFFPALAHYQQYKLLADVVMNERKSNQLLGFQVQYETEKKEKELKLREKDLRLKEQDIALLTEQGKARRVERNALMGGAGLLTLSLGLLYNRYRLKQRTNSRLKLQQDALRAQQEEINRKNDALNRLLGEKDLLLEQKDNLIDDKESLLTEKEWLMKEIHHRVKNNLQVVMSLLDSQADSLRDEAALSAINESQHRMQAMALIHQKLYQTESLARIPMSSYISEVVAYLRDFYDSARPVRIDISADEIDLDVSAAVPLGLILNEAITNAFKYAFPDGRDGRICVVLRRRPQHRYELTVSDNGVGLPADYDQENNSLGMTLIRGFSRQLGGELHITGSNGTSVSLLFEDQDISPVTRKATYAT